jgi:serine/threonine protein kinase
MSACFPEQQLKDFAAGHLETAAAQALEGHLHDCRGCRQAVDEWRQNQAYLPDLRDAIGESFSLDGRPVSSMSHSPLSLLEQCAQLRSTAKVPPANIPGYEIVREIHRGGQGVVYEAIQLSTKRTVAVKVLLGESFAGERAKWRFEREVKLIAALKHPNIVVIHDSGITESRYYFAMDYVRGQPLDTHTRLTTPPVRQLVRLFKQITDAVAYAHRRGVIHRDLKPSNILVSEEGAPCVLDFGLAKLVGDEIEELGPLVSTAGTLMGTLHYMSPEQTLGASEAVDIRTDVYSLGLILYELLTDHTAYNTNVELGEALRRIREVDPDRPSKLRRDVNSELETIVLKAMAKEPERRYQSAGEMSDDLAAWLDGRPIAAKSASSLYVLRKLAVRHGFETLTVATVLIILISLSAITLDQRWEARKALKDKSVSETSARMAYKDMSRFFTDGQKTLRQQALGWFLLEWHADRPARARQIQAELPTEAPEYAAMAFLLDDTTNVEQLRTRLPAKADDLLHFIVGERCFKAGLLEQAQREFELAKATADPPHDWYRLSSAARLEQIQRSRALTTRPTNGGSEMP